MLIAGTEVFVCGWSGGVYECVNLDDSESSPHEIWTQPQDDNLETLPCIESPLDSCEDA